MSAIALIETELSTLKSAMQQTQQQLSQLEQQRQQVTAQIDQALQVLLRQQGAIQSQESLLRKLQGAETPAIPVVATPVDSLPERAGAMPVDGAAVA